jgi:Spherulation-specific family 4
MIVNINNGDDTSYQASLDAAIRDARKRGILVVGYVYTGYGHRDPAIVRNRVHAVFQNYLVDGIFFDEVPTACNTSNQHSGTDYRYYQELANYVRGSQAGGRVVILNPGTQPSEDCWMSIANILVTAESSSLQDYIQNYQDQTWFHEYSPDRFWHIAYNVPSVVGLRDVVNLSLQRGAGWVYVTDQGSANPYGQPPAYWKLEAAEVNDQAVQSPYASFRPASNDENGNPVPGRISIRWISVDGSEWQIFLASDRSGAECFPGTKAGLEIDADYLLQAHSDGLAHLYRYERKGDDDTWIEVPADSSISSLTGGIKLIEADTGAFSGAHLLKYQIRSLATNGTTLFTTPLRRLSLNSTAYEFDIQNHIDH